MNKNRKYKLNENLRPGDLVDVVDSLLEIDRYKPKMGSEADIVVICFKTNTQDVANDLGAYLEWSSERIEDVEVSDASDKDGKFHVYIEINRLPGLNEKILNIVKDVEHATGEQDWKFVGMDGLRKPLDLGSLSQTIIEDPKLYDLPPESREYYIRMKNLTKY